MPSACALPPFFSRYGWTQQDWQNCVRFIETRYPEHHVDSDVSQGGCSYTIRLTPSSFPSGAAGNGRQSFVLQFRPRVFALSTITASNATEWYPTLAPSVAEICGFSSSSSSKTDEILLYRMSLIPGVRLSDLLPQQSSLTVEQDQRYRALLDDLASFHAGAWMRSLQYNNSSLQCDGKIGTSLLPRLRRLELELPSPTLRSIAFRARQDVEAGVLDRLPVVFTHGDLLANNILVDPNSWRINGVIDWAESEMLPFGMSSYALEHLLGYLDSGDTGGAKRFVYLTQADELRRYFLQRLEATIPELRRREFREAMELTRVVGILLWHGSAWNDGRIDRVVELARDAEELAYLEAFLGAAVDGAGLRARL